MLSPPDGAVSGLILAGGQGRRMGGQDKALILLDGKRLVDHLAERLHPQVGALAISANGDAGRFLPLRLPVLPDGALGQGPLAGILSGLFWARDAGAAGIISVPVDAPFLPADLAAGLIAESVGLSRPVHAVAGGKAHPAHAFWPTPLIPALRDFLTSGRKPSLLAFLDASGTAEAAFADAAAFANLNTPEDLVRAARGDGLACGQT